MKKYIYFFSVFLLFSLIVFNLIFNVFFSSGKKTTFTNRISLFTNSNAFETPVLGKSTEDTKEITDEITYWKSIVDSHPDYRDAYMKLVVLNLKIDNLNGAKPNLVKVLEIDPNYQPALEIQESLK